MKDQQDHPSSRVKELSKELEEQFTHIEQERPNKPNFLLVVLLSAAVLIIIFILAIVVLHLGSGRFGSHSFRRHPTSQLVPPMAIPPARLPAQSA